MKKFLVIFTLLCVMPSVMTSVTPPTLWQNKPVDLDIRSYFNTYFIEGKKETFPAGIKTMIGDVLFEDIPGLNIDKKNFYKKVTDLVDQFVANVTPKAKLERGTDPMLYKEIDQQNKAIDAFNKKVTHNKHEIKKLIQSKSNPVETLGGLAALIYEYSDRDEKLELFWRQIVLRSNGYFKEYFLFGQVDEEKTAKKPNSFYQIKTHRPKGWSSLVGLGNEYVDKRGWLSYAYGKLKYPAMIGTAALAYRNREAIGKKFNESGIKESTFGKWADEKYKAVGDSKVGKWVREKYQTGSKYLGDVYDQSTYGQKIREFGKGAKRYLYNYFDPALVGQKQRTEAHQKRLQEQKRILQERQKDNNEMIAEMDSDMQRILDREIRLEKQKEYELQEKLNEEKRSIRRQKDNSEMIAEMDRDMEKILDREMRLEEQKRLKEEKRSIRRQKDNSEMTAEMDRDMEKILDREMRLEEQKRLKEEKRSPRSLQKYHNRYDQAYRHEDDVLRSSRSDDYDRAYGQERFKETKRSPRSLQKYHNRYDKAYGQSNNTEFNEGVRDLMEEDSQPMQKEESVNVSLELPTQEQGLINVGEEPIPQKESGEELSSEQQPQDLANLNEKLQQWTNTENEKIKKEKERISTAKTKFQQQRENALREREERAERERESRRRRFAEQQQRDEKAKQEYLERVRRSENKNPLPNSFKVRGSNSYL